MNSFFGRAAICSLLLTILLGISTYGAPPTILGIDFPAQIPLYVTQQGVVRFSDPDGDVRKAQFRCVDGRVDPFTIEPGVGGVTEGSFGFEIQGAFATEHTLLKVVLVDEEGSESDPVLLSFDRGTPVEGEYEDEIEAKRPTDSVLTLNFFVLGDGATELAAGARFNAQDDPLGKPSELTCRVIEELALPRINGIWDQCGIAFQLGVLYVVRPQNIMLPDRGCLDDILSKRRDGNGKAIPNAEQALYRLEDAVPILNEILAERGESIGRDDRSLFIVGYRLNSGIYGGYALQPGRVALVTWTAVWVDPTTGAILEPKGHISTVAHELGHALGLGHIMDGHLLMHPGLPGYRTGVTLTVEDREIVRENLALDPF